MMKPPHSSHALGTACIDSCCTCSRRTFIAGHFRQLSPAHPGTVRNLPQQLRQSGNRNKASSRIRSILAGTFTARALSDAFETSNYVKGPDMSLS
jgi:hypothetical protein